MSDLMVICGLGAVLLAVVALLVVAPFLEMRGDRPPKMRPPERL